MQALGARQQLFSAACKDLRQPIPTKLHTLKVHFSFYNLSNTYFLHN